jgi:hypothetical protein
VRAASPVFDLELTEEVTFRHVRKRRGVMIGKPSGRMLLRENVRKFCKESTTENTLLVKIPSDGSSVKQKVLIQQLHRI